MKNLLEQCAASFKAGRHHLIMAVSMLYEIREKELWREDYDSLSEYIEQECKMDKGQASKLLTAYEYFVVKGPVELAQLDGVNLEKLYMATRLTGTKQTQFKKALLLGKAELKQQAVFEKTGEECKHPEVIKICATCHVRIE